MRKWGLFCLAMIVCGPMVCGSSRREEPVLLMNRDINLEKVSPVTIGGRVYRKESGFLTVPEKHSRPEGRKLVLPILRIRNQDINPGDPIFWLNGGPGASNLTLKPLARLLLQHDLVMVGYRGVDGETGLDCREIRQALRGDGQDLLGPASFARLKTAIRQCSRRLQSEGKDLSAYTIPEVVEDIETARQALGCGPIQLLGASYGTRVALLYNQKYPQNVSRICLLGANPPGHFLWRPEVTDRQLAYYSRLATGGHDLLETMKRVGHHLPERWLGLRIDPGMVKVMTFLMLFHRGSAAVVFDAYRAADRGDASGLFFMQLAGFIILPRALNWADLFSKGGIDFDPSLDYHGRLNPKDAVLGAPLSRLVWENAEAWPMAAIPAEYKTLQTSATPTLVVSGSVDFSTPAEIAGQELLPKLANGHQVILAEMGHVEDMFSLQPRAFEQLVGRFLDEGVVDASGFRPMPMNFKVALGFPVLAKLGAVLTGTLAVLVLVLLAWLLGIPGRISHRRP